MDLFELWLVHGSNLSHIIHTKFLHSSLNIAVLPHAVREVCSKLNAQNFYITKELHFLHNDPKHKAALYAHQRPVIIED